MTALYGPRIIDEMLAQVVDLAGWRIALSYSPSGGLSAADRSACATALRYCAMAHAELAAVQTTIVSAGRTA